MKKYKWSKKVENRLREAALCGGVENVPITITHSLKLATARQFSVQSFLFLSILSAESSHRIHDIFWDVAGSIGIEA